MGDDLGAGGLREVEALWPQGVGVRKCPGSDEEGFQSEKTTQFQGLFAHLYSSLAVSGEAVQTAPVMSK